MAAVLLDPSQPSTGRFSCSRVPNRNRAILLDASQTFYFPEIFDCPVDAAVRALRETHSRYDDSQDGEDSCCRWDGSWVMVHNMDTNEQFFLEIENAGNGKIDLCEPNDGKIIHTFPLVESDFEGRDWSPCDVLSNMRGQQILSVDGMESGSKRVCIVMQTGTLSMFHREDCCEYVSVEEVHGNPEALVGARILEFRKDTQDDENCSETRMWTFYNLVTDKEDVTIRWVGSSNGYYGVGVDAEWEEDEDEEEEPFDYQQAELEQFYAVRDAEEAEECRLLKNLQEDIFARWGKDSTHAKAFSILLKAHPVHGQSDLNDLDD